MRGKSVWDGCVKAVYGLLFFLLIGMSAYIFYGALDTLQYAEAFEKLLQGKAVLVFLLGTSLLLCACLAYAMRMLLPVLERHFQKSVFLLFGGMILLQVLMVLTVRTSLRQDHLKIFDTAAALLGGGTIGESHFGHYFMKYPNNIPLCLFTSFWLRLASLLGISTSVWMELMKLVNLIFMNLGLFCAFSLICKYRSRRTGLLFLLLLLVNPLWYLLGQMYYTSTISLAFSMGAVWLFDRAKGQQVLWKKYLLYVLTGALLASGYKIRATVIITAAALLIYAVLEQEKFPKPREAAGALLVLAGMAAVFFLYGPVEKKYAGFDPSETGYPAVHWVMMSAQGEGQYNSADDAYTGSFSTKEERTQADVALLKERIREMGPGGLLTLFRNKLRVAFSDGTDDYYGLFRTMRKTSSIQKYVNGGRSDYLALYLHSYHGMMTGLLVLAFVFRAFRGERNFLDLFALQICGAYLFYLIWEVDNAYSIPFLLMLLLWTAEGMAFTLDRLPKGKKQPWIFGGAGVLACGAAVFVVEANGAPVREYAVLQDQETGGSLTLQTDFVQTFRTGQAFDHVDLWVANWDGGANDSVYEMEIREESGAVVAEGEIVGASAPCMAAYTLAFEKVTPEKEQTYRIEICLTNPDCAVKTDFLYYQSGVFDMYEEGALFAPEEIKNVDLAFAVYEERQRTSE
ncbi:MAG: hypothetical protein HFI92_13515 [Lachnospiraceae bacterium]|nr:hypothetical protein [Lachnospiraceae bacterium]